jgi:DNA-binding CsgD family transcriptional regulator
MELTADGLKDFPGARLTPMERDVIVLVCKGMTAKEIGFERNATEQVIKNALGHIYTKIGARNKAELIVTVLRFFYETATAPEI